MNSNIGKNGINILFIKNSIKYILFYSLAMVLLAKCEHSNKSKRTGEIVVEASIMPFFYRGLNQIFQPVDMMNIKYASLQSKIPEMSIQTLPEEVVDRKVRWIIYSDEPLEIFPPLGSSIVVNPGDSIFISYQDLMPVYTGSNKTSLELLNKLMKIEEKMIKSKHEVDIFSDITMEEFEELNRDLDTKLSLQISLIESYRNKISENEYLCYRTRIINDTETKKLDLFTILRKGINNGYVDSSNVNLNAVWDSTQCSYLRSWLKSLHFYNGSIDHIDSYNKNEVMRHFNFDLENDSINSDEKRTYLYFINARTNYNGELREKLMAYILEKRVISSFNFNKPLTELILKDYYSQPGFPEYKQWVKKIENDNRIAFDQKTREKEMKKKENI